MFVWARLGDYPFAGLQAVATRLDVLLSPGSGFSPGGEAWDWLRINTAYAGDRRAMALFAGFGRAARLPSPASLGVEQHPTRGQ
ncbi:hypothetical protein ACV334_38100, partial [Pseudomonas aeruginosa]